MARQRVRESSTWRAAKAGYKSAQERLALQACTGEAINTQDHWKLVGRYYALRDILWAVDR
jgi:hypothetical protein